MKKNKKMYANTRHAFFYKQHFYNENQAKICKKIKQMLSNILRQYFCYLKIFHVIHPRYHPKMIAHILKNMEKEKYVSKDKDGNDHIDKTVIGLRLDKDTNVVNIRSVSV